MLNMKNAEKINNLLYVMVGITHSGNTTYVQQRMDGVPRVALNAVRMALFNRLDCNKEENGTVVLVAKAMVKALFHAGHTEVVLDAMNLSRFHRDEWKDDLWRRVIHVMPCDEAISRARLMKTAGKHPSPYHQRLISSLSRMVKNYELPCQDELLPGESIVPVSIPENYL